jgi:hypothetical protein
LAARRANFDIVPGHVIISRDIINSHDTIIPRDIIISRDTIIPRDTIISRDIIISHHVIPAQAGIQATSQRGAVPCVAPSSERVAYS